MVKLLGGWGKQVVGLLVVPFVLAFLISAFPYVVSAVINYLPAEHNKAGDPTVKTLDNLCSKSLWTAWLPIKVGEMTGLWESPWPWLNAKHSDGSASPMRTYFRVSNIYCLRDVVFSFLVWFAALFLVSLALRAIFLRLRSHAANNK